VTHSASLVDAIFTKCALVYGRDFLSRWEGQDLAEVKADWERELSGFLNQPAAVLHALQNLPADKPPTVLQFRAICNRYEAPRPLELAPPKADPERVRQILGALRHKFRSVA
jgi:hypothetical protein